VAIFSIVAVIRSDKTWQDLPGPDAASPKHTTSAQEIDPMKLAMSACFALALMCGNTGCCGCHPLFPNLGCNGAMGCQKTGIFNWSHCHDTCDQCGDFTGPDIVARTGDNYYPLPATTPRRPGMVAQLHANHRHSRGHRHHMTATRVPPMGDVEVISDEVEVVSAEAAVEETDDAAEQDEANSAPVQTEELPAPAKRIRTTRIRRQ
jgi:hypothetical protein